MQLFTGIPMLAWLVLSGLFFAAGEFFSKRFALVPGGKAYAVSVGSTMDMALIRQLLDDTIAAARILHRDGDLQERLGAARANLLPFKIGANGELQEW